ncbi:MAG: magnesium transporter [Proteobacteria bacterium]|nr:magnesium transporter [Pseudomonadota bacterium]MBU1686459.1 magnesium transporter [Pseudomonadota bacterium]
MKVKTKKELVGKEGTVILDTFRRLIRRNAVENLLKVINKTHPADIAWVFRHFTSDERKFVFNIIAQTANAGEFLSELDQAILLELIENLTPQFMVSILKEVASDDAADILEILPDSFAEETRRLMGKEDREEVEDLLQYPPDTAGGIMSPDYMAMNEEMSVGDAIKKLQDLSEEMEMAFYLYITRGEEGKLSGVLSLRQLLMHPPYRILKNIMNPNVLAVTTDTDQNEVAHMVAQYNFLAIPVIDTTYKLVGIVTVDDVIDVIRAEATEEFLQMAGAGKDREILLKSTIENAMTRAPWLFASWLGGIVAMVIINVFQNELSKVLALASFIPIVMGMGGNIATQSSTIVVRGMATGRINMQELTKIILKEMRVGLLLGTVYGLLLGVLAHFGYGEITHFGLVIGLSVLFSMTLAATVGTSVPLIMRRLDIDAAIATGPFVTTTIDILGVSAYFLVAKLILSL